MTSARKVFDEHALVRSTRDYLIKNNLFGEEANSLPDSALRFPDGSDFRIEIPTVNSLEALITIIDESQKLGIKINRLTETLGIFRHSKKEIAAMVTACKEYGAEFLMSPGPRATYDTSATAQTAQGARIGYRLRGQDQLLRALIDVQRAIDLGVSSFVIYDEGMLSVLNDMRKDNIIPVTTHFKVSAHCGHGNPASLKFLWNLGANSFNPVRDLDLSMISALRMAAPISLDIHTDNPAASGGFMRMYEAPEIVRIASPVYLKTGNSALQTHGEITDATDARRMVQQASITIEMLNEFAPDLKQSPLKCEP